MIVKAEIDAYKEDSYIAEKGGFKLSRDMEEDFVRIEFDGKVVYIEAEALWDAMGRMEV